MIFMTPAQSKQAAAIMQKHGEEGWRIEYKHRGDPTLHWGSVAESLMWNWYAANHRAVRIERVPTRTPLPIEHYKRGMEVQFEGAYDYIILGDNGDNLKVILARIGGTWPADYRGIKKWRWPNETEWHPSYTETVEEREVETLIVEGL